MGRDVFTVLQPSISWSRRYRVVALSVAAHVAVLAIIVFHSPKVIDLHPIWLAFGEGDRTYRITYIAPDHQDLDAETAALQFPHTAKNPRRRPDSSKQIAKPQEQPHLDASAEAGDHNIHAGSPLGTMIDGPIAGHEVHVAYPTLYPDPPVNRAELPRDLAGDVVIEVTIDSEGNVVETKIVQSIGHGIDEKIEATLRHWHYQPATLDGTPVASRHDVHFHFPS